MILSLLSTSIRSHSATFSACFWNSFWYLERSDAQRVIISSIDLFLSRDWGVGRGPDVDAPRLGALAASGLAVVVGAGTGAVAAAACVVAALDEGLKREGRGAEAVAVADDLGVVTACVWVFSTDFSLEALPKLENSEG